MAEAHALGFDHIEISHGTKISLLPGLMQAFDAGQIQVTSLHNFCPPPVEVIMDAPDAYEFTSSQDHERDRALSLSKQTIQMAARFKAPRVVLHMGSVPIKRFTDQLEAMVHKGEIYSREYTALKLKFVEQREKYSAHFLERARSALNELLPVAQEYQVMLGVETRSHYEQVPNEREMLVLMEEYKDNPWVGAWHDFGHVQRKANLGLLNHFEHLSAIAPYLKGCHVHDVEWPAKDHRVPLTAGGVNFDQLLPLIPPDVPLIWELSPSQRRGTVLGARQMWKQRYGF